MKVFALIITVLLFCKISFSQTLGGVVVDENNEVIPYATIFIKEMNMGTTSNSEGEYQLNLTEGDFTIQFRSMGYEQKVIKVSIDTVDVKKDVVLSVQHFQLHEIRVYKDNVDPAYPIMKRAIAMAPYFQNQIQEYVADVYIKGNAKLESVPKFIEKKMNVNVNGTSLKLGDVAVGESFSEIKFEAPDTYHQKIISSNMSGLSNQGATFDMGLITESPYQPTISDNIINPLSPQAFSYYKFRYEGFFSEGDYLVNKVRVLPKRKSKQLFSGYLYIIDGLWCLQGLELDIDQGVFDLHIDIQLAEVDEGILLPISHAIKVKGKVMGVAGSAVYSSSVKYKTYIKNEHLEMPGLLKEFYVDKAIEEELVFQEKSKAVAKIDEIMAKEDLTKRDAVRLARLMKKESKKEIKEEKPSLEIVNNYHVEKEDSINNFSDEYWESMRPKPLSVEEQLSYKKSDSLMAVQKSIVDTTVTSKDKEKSRLFYKIIGKKKFEFKNDSIRLSFSSLVAPGLLSFNAVEGLKYRQEFKYSQLLKNTNQLDYDGWLGYSFAQKSFQWKLHGKYQFAPMHGGVFEYSSGNVVDDYMGDNAVSPIVNTVSSLFFKDNYARYYKQKYLRFSSKIEPLNGFDVRFGFNYSQREHLQNETNFSFFRRELNYAENELESATIGMLDLKDETAAIIAIDLEYTPMNYYKISKGRKINVGSKWPTFSLGISTGINGLLSSTSDWTKIDLGIKQSIEFGIQNKITYNVNFSRFLVDNSVGFADFSQVNVNNVPVEVKKMPFGFKLLPYYAYNTNKQLLTIGVNYQTPNLLLKYLPWFSMRNWKENLHFNYLTMPGFENYFEAGYSLSGIMGNSELGVYSGFKNGEYTQTGVRAIVRF